ncbi:MAG: hypothetical protein QG650_174 [Patescibacteria group bacterium]|nr:hypothetical protein [Patescibacteria group bacterium]
MSKVDYHKLVRDRIPEIIRTNGDTPSFRILENRAEFVAALAAKILEESNEAHEAALSGDRDEITKEIADVLEVLDAVAREFSISPEEIRRVQTDRREKRGGFENRIFLESAE